MKNVMRRIASGLIGLTLLSAPVATAQDISPLLTQPQPKWVVIPRADRCEMSTVLDADENHRRFYSTLSYLKSGELEFLVEDNNYDLSRRAGRVLGVAMNGRIFGEAPIVATPGSDRISMRFRLAPGFLDAFRSSPTLLITLTPTPVKLYTLRPLEVPRYLALLESCHRSQLRNTGNKRR